jgi:hypothetical protein
MQIHDLLLLNLIVRQRKKPVKRKELLCPEPLSGASVRGFCPGMKTMADTVPAAENGKVKFSL